jgi:hypothetical protein
MNLNLARPYDATPSPPNDSKIIFFSREHDDLLFPDEKEIKIECIAGLRNVGLSWTLTRNDFKQPFMKGTADALPANRYVITIRGAGLKRGFYDLRVELDLGNGTLDPGISTFGYRVSEMPSTQDRPPDFHPNWAK